jgi:hypothetical protein
MKSAKTIIARIEAEHWLLLECSFEGDWIFKIWGVHPLSRRVGPVGEQTAKQQALCAARQHLESYGLSSAPLQASEVPWRVAVLQQVA